MGFTIEDVGTIYLVSNKTLSTELQSFFLDLVNVYYEYMARNPPKKTNRHFAIVNKHLITKL